MYTGPTNGGVMPMDNSVWGHTTYPSVTCGECPLSATHNGVDGRTTRGHVDDYWVDYGSFSDPYYGNWAEHGYAECTADFMGTNQYHNWQNTDGSTRFVYYTDGSPTYDYTLCEGWTPPIRDGCHGMRLFVESRGYNVLQNYNQYIYGYEGNTLGFSFEQFKAEIDAGRPVLIQVTDHTMLGYGYNTAGSKVYIHDTWDHSDHEMTWGGTYSGLQHYAVTVIHLTGGIPPNKPDIVITDIWNEGSKIYYKIKNIGTEKAGSSRTSLTVDGVYKKYDSVRSLGAGEERTESFRYKWACTNPSDEIKVCADYKNAVAESNEGNNGKTEMWECEGRVEYWAVIAGEGYTCGWADNDAYDMYDGLLSYSNWKAENIRLLVSNAAGTKHDCTRDNIQAGIAWMASQADADDVCLFFYAGHGDHNTDIAPLDEADGWDEYICPEGGNIRDDELDAWMTTPIKGKKVVIIDSCFSGGFVKGDRARTIPGVPYAELTDGFVRDLNKPGYVTLTAADDDEGAYGDCNLHLNNGVFTYYVVEGLGGLANADADNDISAEEMYNYAEPKTVIYSAFHCSQYGPPQHPQLYDGVTGELPVVKW